jgi:predicted RNase H-like HicB family nuclease
MPLQKRKERSKMCKIGDAPVVGTQEDRDNVRLVVLRQLQSTLDLFARTVLGGEKGWTDEVLRELLRSPRMSYNRGTVVGHQNSQRNLPMFAKYIRAAMHRAQYEILPSQGTFYGEIPGFNGVWAEADTLAACQDELEEVLEDWILLSISRHLPLPVVDGIELSIKETA